jgi:hypothetical protein
MPLIGKVEQCGKCRLPYKCPGLSDIKRVTKLCEQRRIEEKLLEESRKKE